jgi:hypothetical protein
MIGQAMKKMATVAREMRGNQRSNLTERCRFGRKEKAIPKPLKRPVKG